VTESAAKPYPEPYEWRNERDQLADAGALTLLLTERHHQQRRRDVQRGRECPYVVDVDAAPTGLDVLDKVAGQPVGADLAAPLREIVSRSHRVTIKPHIASTRKRRRAGIDCLRRALSQPPDCT